MLSTIPVSYSKSPSCGKIWLNMVVPRLPGKYNSLPHLCSRTSLILSKSCFFSALYYIFEIQRIKTSGDS